MSTAKSESKTIYAQGNIPTPILGNHLVRFDASICKLLD